MQVLVYTFIALAALGVGCTAYFGLTFTPAEAIMAALSFSAVAVVLMERSLRQRAENRLEKAIEDLAQLLAAEGQVGTTLGQRVNALADLNAGRRLEGVEADVSVLGTVIRQIAEAVSDIEERASRPQPGAGPTSLAAVPAIVTQTPQPVVVPVQREPEPPLIPIETLRQALADNRLIYHVQPIITLPQRRPHGYDLVPRLMLDNGELADRAAFMPRQGNEDLLRHIEGLGLIEAIAIGRRSRSADQPINLFIPLSRATLGEWVASEQLIVSLEANRAIASSMVFVVTEAEWQMLAAGERAIVDGLVKKGAGFSLSEVKSLRVDVAELAGQGVRSLRVDATRFIDAPEAFTDFHASDIANYLNRFGVSMMATGVASERQILELLDIGIAQIQGPHIAAPGPVRPDLMLERPKTAAPVLRRAEGIA
ncbi:cyclic-di-GMP phosphodiesterase TipF (flagellum assembly factor) [Devosia sp. UYZn731]|uniref:EAL domain-containing protein n=1 Tax=Devosia sp. UYZn731 TaxID=3156345 RepID=UPI003397EBB0